jgi:signal transduction histidine kinase
VGTVRVVEQVNPARRLIGVWASRRDAAFDLCLMLLLQALAVTLTWPLLRHGWWGLVIQLGMGMFLLLRRVFPVSVLAVTLLSTVVLSCVGRLEPRLLTSLVSDLNQAWIVLAAPFVAYSAVVYGADRRRVWLMIGVMALVAARPWDSGQFVRVIGIMIVILMPALLGRYVAGLNDRVERAEREQHRLAEQARAEERVRLAAEMHDVVTHRISLMVLQAGALGVTATDAATREAAEDLRAAGCQALEELRDLVGVLRSSTGAVAEDLMLPRAGGQAGVPDFAELFAESESVGVVVKLDQRGDPSLASPVVARTAYRIIQESLTNVRKHAPGATALVRLHYSPDQVRLTVRNTMLEQRADVGLTASGSGTGLLGLRQRVELVSGTLVVGPIEDGGFQVDAMLPAYVPTREERPDNGPAPGSPRLGPGPVGRPNRRSSAASVPIRPHRVRGGG